MSLSNDDVQDLANFLGMEDIVEIVTGNKLLFKYRGVYPVIPVGEGRVVFVAGAPGDGGHFHYMFNKDGRSKIVDVDSYKLGYQIGGTNGLCQSFAMMIAANHVPPDGGFMERTMYVANWMAMTLNVKANKAQKSMQYWFPDDNGGEFFLTIKEIIQKLLVVARDERYGMAVATQQDLPDDDI